MKSLSVYILIAVSGLLFSCGKSAAETSLPRQVRAAAVSLRETAEEIHGFGALSYLKKVDIAAPSDAVLETLVMREGDAIAEGEIIAILSNPQINLAVRRAENAFSQAQAARDLSMARLSDGELQVEAKILENEKAEAELSLARRSLGEQKRKHEKEEALFKAGGISSEAILNSRFAFETAEAQLVMMEKELEIRRIGLRIEDLLAAGINSPNEESALRKALIAFAVKGLYAEARAAEASLEAAARELESSKLLESELIIKSPQSGIIGARYAEEGERLKREDKIFTLIDTVSLYAIFSVSESDALKLCKGMAAKVSLDGTGRTYDGAIDLVSPQADSQSFTFMVRVLLPSDGEGLLRPGMFARISIAVESPRKIKIIPESAISLKKEKMGRIFTINGNMISERMVELGKILGDDREIISGLEAGEVVVLRPDAALQDGAYVSVAN
ncbi:efflux RND transporter periplasmic adaptor subunit [Leadbettera azotonutricia]|uniref:Efflux transporter, RND family, MFP subunit n=1 Tax=Leadbettera azotonutricia (strain ATCC BAA-888 / DSM 13862 / ZAS-9) TaxID=545695 RepID=F5Y6N1_LEAAZ|nr:efflux RND transporter periplasmic adaptor subunit [Leadbettera azotonutricia]AEF80195.1 efflux transporter, RND family, MFP subunit [Leadbettera azotonutricia ZAS-9]